LDEVVMPEGKAWRDVRALILAAWAVGWACRAAGMIIREAVRMPCR
jgi:hypothetical protein